MHLLVCDSRGALRVLVLGDEDPNLFRVAFTTSSLARQEDRLEPVLAGALLPLLPIEVADSDLFDANPRPPACLHASLSTGQEDPVALSSKTPLVLREVMMLIWKMTYVLIYFFRCAC